jgi:hypothetical protein
MAKATTDKTTLALIELVKKQKKEISDAERPNLKTNCSFSFTGKPIDAINLNVEHDIIKLIRIVSFLTHEEQSYNIAAASLGIIDPPKFTWDGYSTKEWVSDVQSRINKIQINQKRAKLDELQRRLDSVISPELKRQMELDSIAQELGIE